MLLLFADLMNVTEEYAISGYLASILSPVVENTDYTVKNPGNLQIS